MPSKKWKRTRRLIPPSLLQRRLRKLAKERSQRWSRSLACVLPRYQLWLLPFPKGKVGDIALRQVNRVANLDQVVRHKFQKENDMSDTDKTLANLVVKAMSYEDIPGQLRAINLLGACTKAKWASVVKAVHKKHNKCIDEGIGRLSKWGEVKPSAAAVKDVIAKILQSDNIPPYPELIWGLTPKAYQTEIDCKDKAEGSKKKEK
jgi:hypothetical protein